MGPIDYCGSTMGGLFPVCFCVLKVFFKKINFFLFFLFQINMFLVFSNYFYALVSKIIF